MDILGGWALFYHVEEKIIPENESTTKSCDGREHGIF